MNKYEIVLYIETDRDLITNHSEVARFLLGKNWINMTKAIRSVRLVPPRYTLEKPEGCKDYRVYKNHVEIASFQEEKDAIDYVVWMNK